MSRVLRPLRTPLGVLTVVTLIILVLVAVLASVLWGDDARLADPSRIAEGPSDDHLFGTDAGGRDILLRTLVATRLSVGMALLATVIGVTVGIALGLLPQLLGPRIARAAASGINIAIAFPSLLLAIVLAVVLGRSAFAAVAAVAAAMAPDFARLTYTMSSSVAGRDFVQAARVLGVPKVVVLLRHVLPNIRDALLVRASISAGICLVAFASLSFLGLGVQAPEFDWGRLLDEGQSRIFVSPASALVPGAAIVLAGLVFTMFGELLAKSLPGAGSRGRSRAARRRHGPLSASTVPTPTGATADSTDASPVLRVRDLTVADADGSVLVDGLSIDVGAGEVLGVVGESGSGKSLTMMAVAGLLDPSLDATASTLEFDGVTLDHAGRVDAERMSRTHGRHLGEHLAVVFQDPMSSLNPAIRVGPQVAEVGRLRHGLGRRAAAGEAVDRLDSVHIPDADRRAHQYPHQFSGGMRQRAMIAMGLMGSPRLVLADEPTTALDVTVQKGVLGLLRDLNREQGTALILVSHDMAVVAAMCHRVMVMYRGRAVEVVDSDDLIAGRVRHPYTHALLDSVPSMQTDRDRPLTTIPEDADFPTGPVDDRTEVTR
ncbi:dipeptide/oligopeptide/nickel ABC transporter permease/ATP-binding protein [Solicola gregarius]|uniref:Dipeptide/oligopeptide/nickel ABC transporter permease/ATP-binding protein n=1 Tax=Solicola gregarius TaxID=2908642 RepID=A0AA46TJL2_9ACTN|nr:dipeptide/oligopeptide/nickel ABC transporter permease/ATP-binding protein [Solicola gregarius]UYM06064.1 dipeptide/oligopeptide/nickel ABC transporter permease/ATP-binding protein [Solicola gregarius]